MKICMFTRITPVHGTKGGMELHGEMLSRGLVRRGHQVSIITTKHPEGIEHEQEEGVDVYYTEAPSGKYRQEWWLESVRKFIALQERIGFDLVWSQSAGGDYYAQRLKERYGVPLVSILHGTFGGEICSALRQLSWSMGSFYYLALAARLYYHRTRRRSYVESAEAVIVVSEELREEVLRAYPVDSRRVFLVPNGVDEERFRPLAEQGKVIRQRYGIAESTKVLVTVGRLERGKGVHVAIQALPRISDVVGEKVVLLIVGQGRYREELERIVRREELSSQVFFCGFVPHQELLAFYNAGDLFLMPTLMEEAFGLAVAEAMACGKPVVASHIGGIPTIVNDQDMLFRPGDVEELSRKVTEILTNESLATRLGHQARATICAKFTLRRMVEDTAKIFEGCVKSGK